MEELECSQGSGAEQRVLVWECVLALCAYWRGETWWWWWMRMDHIFSNSSNSSNDYKHEGVWIPDLIISIDFCNFVSLFSPYVLALIEKNISNISDSVSPHFCTPWISWKICITFSTSFLLFGNTVEKHSEETTQPNNVQLQKHSNTTTSSWNTTTTASWNRVRHLFYLEKTTSKGEFCAKVQPLWTYTGIFWHVIWPTQAHMTNRFLPHSFEKDAVTASNAFGH